MPSPVLGTGFFRGFLANGAPNASGTVQTFAAGTSTPLASYPTYNDAVAGTNANSNPLTLNASGEAQIWVNALAYKFVMKDSSGTVLETVDNYSPAAAAPSPSPSQWVQVLNPATLLNAVFTFLTTTTFQVNANAVDLTAAPYFLGVGDRIRTNNTAGFVYSTIVSISFLTPNVSITVVNDGASVLDSGLNAMYYGVQRYGSPSAPAYLDPRSALNVIKNGTLAGTGASAKVTAWLAPSLDALSEWASPQFTCKYPGRYLVDMQAQVADSSGTATGVVFGIGDNATANFQASYSNIPLANAPSVMKFTKVMQLTAGQVIAMWWTAPATTTMAINSSINIIRLP